MDSTLPTSGVADELIERQKHAENQESQQQSPGQDGQFVEWIALDGGFEEIEFSLQQRLPIGLSVCGFPIRRMISSAAQDLRG